MDDIFSLPPVKTIVKKANHNYSKDVTLIVAPFSILPAKSLNITVFTTAINNINWPAFHASNTINTSR